MTTFIATYTSYYLKTRERDDESDKVLDMVNCMVDDLIFSDKLKFSLVLLCKLKPKITIMPKKTFRKTTTNI